MFKQFSFALTFVYLCFVSPLFAAPVATDSALGKALTAMSSLKGFSCDFRQELKYAEGGKRLYTGELAVSRPGKFRWHYIKPYEQLYISNGQGVLLYEPDLMQVQKLEDLGEVDPVVLQLLDGRIGLADVQVLASENNEDGISWHVRIGKAEQSVEVWLGTKKQKLQWIESRDALANINRLYLLNVVPHAPNDETFEFITPEGVDVIGA
jgi:outer membrane lipoprotein carrier protein